MAVNIAVITGTILSSDTGTKDFTAAGFGTPKAAMIFATRAGLDETLAVRELCIGVTDGTNSYAIGGCSDDNVSTSNTSRSMQSGAVIIEVTESGASTTGLANFSAWVTDGIRLTMASNPFAYDHGVVIVLFGGSDVNAKTGSTDLTTMPVAETLTFQPDVVFSMTHGWELGNTGTRLIHSVGVSDGTNFRSTSSYDDDGEATADVGATVQNAASFGQFYNGTLSWTAKADGFDSSGFDFTLVSGSQGTDDVAWLALELNGKSVSVGSVDLPTSVSSDWTSPTLGFKPGFLLLGSSHCQAENTTYTTADGGQMGLHVADNTSFGSVSVSSEDGANPTDTESSTFAQFMLTHTDAGAASFDIDAISFTAAGWKAIAADINAANGTTRKAWYLACQNDYLADLYPLPYKRYRSTRQSLIGR